MRSAPLILIAALFWLAPRPQLVGWGLFTLWLSTTYLTLGGIEIGPVGMVQKSLAAMKQIPRMAGVVRDLTLVFPNLPNGPTMPSKLIPDEASSSRTITELLSPEGLVSPRQVPRGLPHLSSEGSALLTTTGHRRGGPDA